MLSERARIKPFLVMDLLDRANALQAAGKDVIHLEAGQPGTPAPRVVREAAIQAVNTELLGYTEALGMPALRERIAGYYRERYGLEIPARRIVVTTGSSAGFVLSFLSLFDEGAGIAIGAPYYPAYPNIMHGLGYRPVIVETELATGYQPTVRQLQDLNEPVDGLLIASPANPTGSMIEDHVLRQLAEYCAASNVSLISDEIYHGIVYGEPAHTMLEYTDEAIVINSFSKYFSMTGWRVGWMVVPEHLIRSVECLSQNFYISVPVVSQLAAIKAFDAIPELDGYVEKYRQNRSMLLNALPGMGIENIAPADGAFYLYADIGHLTDDPVAFCIRMLEETGVATTPGIDFDTGRRALKMRLSYAGTGADIEKALDRMANWLPGV